MYVMTTSKHTGWVAGNLYVHSGDEKVDVGLCVKHGGKGMCVPDYVQAQPDNNGWAYSQALVAVIEQYKVGSAALPAEKFIGVRTCMYRLSICPLSALHMHLNCFRLGACEGQ